MDALAAVTLGTAAAMDAAGTVQTVLTMVLRNVVTAVSVVALTAPALPISAGQASERPAFEVVSIRPTEPSQEHARQTASFDVASVRLSDSKTMVSHRVTDTRVDLVKISLRQLLWMAFEIDPFCCRDRIPGAEPLGRVIVDIRATIPAGAGRQQVPEMLKSLLIQRFGLRTHLEPRPTDGYELVVGPSGIKMEEVQPANELDKVFPSDPSIKILSDGEAVIGRTRTITSARGIRTITDQSMYDRTFTTRGTNQITAVRMAMSDFVSILAANTGQPVLDRTNLTGVYAFSVELPRDAWLPSVRFGTATSVDGTPLNDPTGVSATRAVEQLGLRMQPRRIPIDTIVIDRIERIPSEN